MKTIKEKVDILIEAMPYIRNFRGGIVVIKFGGSAMEDKRCFTGVLSDIAFMECVGLKPVIVHGGGAAISRRMKKEGRPPSFVKGRRITDKASVKLVEEVLGGEVNPSIVQALHGFGANAIGISGVDILRAEKFMPLDDDSKGPMDIGFVGLVSNVDTMPIRRVLDSSVIPVITPLGRGQDGHIYNINADDAATAIAGALRARKLVFLSDVPGLLKDPRNPDSVISHLKRNDVDLLIKNKSIAGGMLPKVGAAMAAMDAGVGKVHIIDGRLPHSLLLEIFTHIGIGTEIVHDDQDK